MEKARCYLYARAILGERENSETEQLQALREYILHGVIVGEYYDVKPAGATDFIAFETLLDNLKKDSEPSTLLVTSPTVLGPDVQGSIDRIQEASHGKCSVFTPMLCELGIGDDEPITTGNIEQQM